MLKELGMPKKILIVEDGNEVRAILVHMFKSRGFLIAEATSGTAGLASFKELDPDLIITDYFMPGMNGQEMAAQIKALKPTVKIIMLTCDINLDKKNLTDIDLLFRKPFRSQAFIQAAVNLLNSTA